MRVCLAYLLKARYAAEGSRRLVRPVFPLEVTLLTQINSCLFFTRVLLCMLIASPTLQIFLRILLTAQNTIFVCRAC